jgi:hypothetical protein
MGTIVDSSKARALLVDAARSMGWDLSSASSLREIEHELRRCVARIEGAQDREHAENGIRSALEAAQMGNAAYVAGGLWEAKKVLELLHYDRNALRLQGPSPLRDPERTSRS